MDGDGVDAVGALTQQVLRSSDGGGDRVLPMLTAPLQQKRHRCESRSEVHRQRNQTPHLGDQLLVHLAGHVLSQLAADVGQCVLTCLVGVQVVGGEHRTGGDGAVLRGSLGLLAGVVAGLVRVLGVGRSTRSSM